MRINNVQNFQRSEIVSTSRQPSFQAVQAKKAEKVAEAVAQPLLPQSVIDHFGLDITKAVKYKGEPNYTPAPEPLAENVKSYFHMLKVDWATRIDPSKQKKSYQ